MRGNVACDKRVAVLQGLAPPVSFYLMCFFIRTEVQSTSTLTPKAHTLLRGTPTTASCSCLLLALLSLFCLGYVFVFKNLFSN